MKCLRFILLVLTAGAAYAPALTPGKRSAIDVAKASVNQLTAAIRAEDRGHLITLGTIPWATVWPTAKPVFYSPEVSGALDFASIHVYPSTGEVPKALAALEVYKIGKPLVSFYWGRTAAEYAAATDRKEAAALIGGWLDYFTKKSAFMKQP